MRKAKVKKTPRFSKEELNEKIDTILTTYNPYMSENCVEFDRKTQTFNPIFDYRKPVTAIILKGSLRRKSTEGDEVLLAETRSEEEMRMRNKFSFRSVDTQPMDINTKEKGNEVDPSLFRVLKFKGTASKAEIIAAYEEHEKKKKEVDKYSWIKLDRKKISQYAHQKPAQFRYSSRRFLRLCERMVDQNLLQAQYIDYRYYDNPKGDFPSEDGSLLPLWVFSCPLTKGLCVTDIVWNTYYLDLFAVGFKRYAENEDDLGLMRSSGCVCVYSLKGPSDPEKVFESAYAVRCLTFHPVCPHLLAAGCDGGVVSVYDLRRERNEAAGFSQMTERVLHGDTVTQVKWLPDVLPQKLCTVSKDGTILHYLFMMNDLFLHEIVMTPNAEDWPVQTPAESGTGDPDKSDVQDPDTKPDSKDPTDFKPDDQRSASDSHYVLNADVDEETDGSSVPFCTCEKDLFMEGPEPGIHPFLGKRPLDYYDYDHKHSVRRVDWNPYHPKVFLACNEEAMTVRIWHHSLRESVFDFFFKNGVKDACWAPFSSTLFAAISGNAVVYVFDIFLNKREAVATYPVYSDKENISLTTLCFHPRKPFLMVGDEKGIVTSFKLSPNLRSSLSAMETVEEMKFVEAEVAKMEKLLTPAKGRQKTML